MPYGIRIQLLNYPSIQLRAAGMKHLNIKHQNLLQSSFNQYTSFV